MLLSRASSLSTSRRLLCPSSRTTGCCHTATRLLLSRSFTPKSEYQYQYPSAKERPEITRTNSSEALQQQSPKTAAFYRPAATPPHDPFDDAGVLSETERTKLRTKQSLELKRALALSPYCTPITTTRPSHVPPNVPDQELSTPMPRVTTLPNGVRVVSQEFYGQLSTIAAVCRVGSRYETTTRSVYQNSTYNAGVANLLEGLILSKSEADFNNTVWGSTANVASHSFREQSLFSIDLLRPHVESAVEWLQHRLLQPHFDRQPEAIAGAKRTALYQSLDYPLDVWLEEALHLAAYGNDQQLGHAHYITAGLPSSDHETAVLSPEELELQALSGLEHLTPATLDEFWTRHVIQQPNGLVFSAAGVEHDSFVQLIEQHFGDMKSAVADIPRTTRLANTKAPEDSKQFFRDPYFQRSVYRGGELHQERDSPDGLVRVAIGVPVGGWHSSDLVTTCVLQTLLGGGSSFSSGGPGKGMYSRLYRRILNQYNWAEAAEATTAIHDESGLLVLTGSTYPDRVRDMVRVLSKQLSHLRHVRVDSTDLERARNMLQNNVLTQLESRFVVCEDLGRQLLTFNQREDVTVTCEKIRAVTAEDVQELVQRALQSRIIEQDDETVTTTVTLASVGPDLSQMPSLEEVSQWLE